MNGVALKAFERLTTPCALARLWSQGALEPASFELRLLQCRNFSTRMAEALPELRLQRGVGRSKLELG